MEKSRGKKVCCRIPLNGSDWRFKGYLGEDWVWRGAVLPDTRDTHGWLSGTVPGSVHQDLLCAGEIPDPYVDRNSLLVEWIPQRSWVYTKHFYLDDSYRGKQIRLVLEGIDYEATVFLNGQCLGDHRGMFVPARFDVGDVLSYGGKNLLAVVLKPAPPEEPQVGRTSRVRTHKSRMNYGWDFCPRMIHIGIWDDVYLEVTGTVRVEDVFVRPQLSEDRKRAEISLSTRISSADRNVVHVDHEVRFRGETIRAIQTRHAVAPGETSLHVSLTIDRPRLWWPNGKGQAHRYEAVIRVTEESGMVTDERYVSFGIRDIRLVPNEGADPEARPYTFFVNGEKTYINGWNWVPIDVLYGVERPDKLDHLLHLAREAGVNLFRVWGGGLIEKRSFYERCDRLGIMVWQEFIQSSSGIENRPPDDSAFVAMMVREAETIVERRRNHPSLVLWCGGNELHHSETELSDEREPVLSALRDVVRRLDPDRLWLPTSPSGKLFSNRLKNIAKDPRGLHDVHGPWEHQGLNGQYELYNAGTSLFHSEFGVEGMANLKAIRATISPEYRSPVTRKNPVWYHRGGWWINEPFIQKAFGGIDRLEILVRASQFLQAEGLRYAVESNRRRQFQNSGSLPWQFNESLPNGFCTSAVDYFGEPKMAYYAVARAYRPLCLSASFDRQVWGGRSPFEASLWIVNATRRTGSARVTARLLDAEGKTIGRESREVRLPVNGAAWLMDCRFFLGDLKGELFFLDLILTGEEGELLDRCRYLFSRTDDLAPMLALSDTSLHIRTEKRGQYWRLRLRNAGDNVALLTGLEDAREHPRRGFVSFDANHFHLMPGEEREVLLRWNKVPEGERCISVGAWNTGYVRIGKGEKEGNR